MISDNPDYVSKAKFLSTQARDKAPHYQHSTIGYNYRMSNVLAGIGRGQLEVITERVSKRRSNFNFYRQKLEHLKTISFVMETSVSFSNRWLTTILVNPTSENKATTEDLHITLERENIETRPLWKPMHLQPIFKDCPSYLNGVSEKLFKYGLCLPSGSNLSDQDLDRVVSHVNQVFESYGGK